MTANDKLREALNAAANYIDALGGDSRSYRQALAASKQEPSAKGYCEYCCAELPMPKVQSGKQEPQAKPAYPPDDGPLTDEQIAAIRKATSKREPQAQAKPDWKLHQFQSKDGEWHNFVNERHYEATVRHGDWPIRELITLQSHREAMAKTQAACLESVAAVRIAFDEHIAKKDAALKACVEAPKEVNEWRLTGIGRPPEQTSMDAITQGQEAQG